jgi:RecB family exonuclease
MKYNPYSASALALFEQCPRKFKFYKIDKVKVPWIRTDALVRGEIVHLLLEHYDKDKKFQIQEIKKLQKKDTAINKDLVKQSFDIYNRFRDTDLGKEILLYKPLGREMKIALKIQDKNLIPCDYKDKDTIFRGMIDAIFVNTETDEVFIIDWKTGKDKSTGDYKQAPDQLLYYASWYFANFPVDNISIMYVFVEHENKYLKYDLSRDRLSHYNKMLLTNIAKCEREENFEKIESQLCDWCEYQDLCINESKK